MSTSQSVVELNEQFAIAHHLSFRNGVGGLPVADIRNASAIATISLYGGQVLSYHPHNWMSVLWLSRHAMFTQGKAIRGGVPICWPWFGPHPSDPSLPAHGFARTSMWQVRSSRVIQGGATELVLVLVDDETTRSLWPYHFDLKLTIGVGREMTLDLRTTNTDEASFAFGQALHTYLVIDDIAEVRVTGLEGTSYIDQVDGRAQKTQDGPVKISGETDRIYLDTTAECIIHDAQLDRRIRIAKSGSRTTVVWNPWKAKAKQLTDFGDDEYRRMLCVETANADQDIVLLEPGETHHLRAIIAVERPESE